MSDIMLHANELRLDSIFKFIFKSVIFLQETHFSKIEN